MDPNAPDTLDQVRINVAFEQMILSVLTGAGIGAVVSVLTSLAGAVSAGAFSFSMLLGAFLQMALVSFMVFLTGFFASVIVGAPLFIFLEKRKRRTPWPYLAASLAIGIIIFVFVSGGLPSGNNFNGGLFLSVFIPAGAIAIIFARRMRPIWAAAIRAEEGAVGVYRLH